MRRVLKTALLAIFLAGGAWIAAQLWADQPQVHHGPRVAEPVAENDGPAPEQEIQFLQGNILGVVVADSGGPVTDATVIVTETAPPGLPQRIAVGANGAFQAVKLKPGLYSLVAHMGSLTSDTLKGVVVRVGEDTAGIKLVLHAGGFLDATVRDLATGQTLEACTVRQGDQSLPCNHDGHVAIGPLPPGSTQLRVSAPGYVPQDLTTNIRAGVRGEADIPLLRGATLSGTVYGPGRVTLTQPASLRTAHYALESPKPVETSDSTEVTGRFKLEGVAPGRLRLWASAQGSPEAGTPEIEVGPGEVLSGIDIVLGAGGTITGTVIGVNGAPAHNVRVAAIRASDKAIVASAISGLDGSFHIDGLGADEYAVAAESDAGRGVAEGVRLEAQGKATVTVTLRAEFVEGFVHTPAGQPVANAVVTIFTTFSDSRNERFSLTNADGTFRVERLGGGPYRVRAEAQGKARAEVAGVQASAHVDIVLDTGGRIEGVVRASGLHPPDSFDVKIVPMGGERAASRAGGYRAQHLVSPDGTFAFADVPPGSYEVDASAPGRTGDQATVEVTTGETSQVSLVLGDAQTISGTVVRNGTPVAGCLVGSGAVSGSDGTFTLAGSDSATVFAFCPDGSRGGAPVDPSNPDQTVTIQVGSSAPGDAPQHQTFGGIGAMLQTGQQGIVAIASVMEGGPAFMSGLQAGDQIVAVDGAPTQGAPVMAVVQEIRGTLGTTVDLQILRPASGATFDVSIQRDLIST